jgi:hypothetical protein
MAPQGVARHTAHLFVVDPVRRLRTAAIHHLSQVRTSTTQQPASCSEASMALLLSGAHKLSAVEAVIMMLLTLVVGFPLPTPMAELGVGS